MDIGEDKICGLHAVLSALRKDPHNVDTVWLNEERTDNRSFEIIHAARQAGITLHRVPRAKLDQLTGGERHQGVVARCRAEVVRNERDLEGFLQQLSHTPLLVVLDGVQDPHNLGACLRCADSAGADAVIFPRDRAVSITAAVRRAASGATESVAMFRVTNLSRTLARLKQAGIWLVGSTEQSEADLYAVDLTGPLALVLGGEAQGLRRLTREHCDQLIRIPMRGAVPSLNVAVATAVCLYEALRQRRTERVKGEE
ncbi:MAG: 23S rRNA (guanosine(2251)-2'-O)-methyltransferase RlmB [Acidiferrobacterales bacterium]